MSIGVLDSRAIRGTGGPNVVQAVLLTLGQLNFGHCVTPRLLYNRSFVDRRAGRKDVVLLAAYAARVAGKGINVVCRNLLDCSELFAPARSVVVGLEYRLADGPQFGQQPDTDSAI